MLFNEFGKKENPPVMLLHGMMQDWHSEYEFLKPLEKHYRLIIPAQDGFYDGSGDFTSFADRLKNIFIRITAVKFTVLMVHHRADLCSQSFSHEIKSIWVRLLWTAVMLLIREKLQAL